MKMSREALKELVKECLMELLTEGLGNVAKPRSQRSQIAGIAEQRSRRPQGPQRQAFDARLDTPVSQGRAGSGNQQAMMLKEAIKRESGGNPVMAAIFADTAASPDFLAGDRAASSITQHEQFAGAPEEVFGEDTASRWAHLAFMEPSNKKLA